MVKTTGTVTDWSSEYKKDVEKMMRFFEQKSPDDIIRGMIVWDSVPKIMKPDVINSFYARDVSSSSLIGFGSFDFYPKIAAMKLLKISKTTIDPIGFLGFSILLTSEIEKECKFYKESKTGFFFKSRLIKNINNILKIFPEEVALNFIETFVDKDEHILLRSKIKSLVDSFEQQLIYKNYQNDIYSMVSIAALLHIKMDRLFSRQIVFYNKNWNQLIWCESNKIASSRQPFDEDRQLILDFSDHQLRNSLYSFENLDKKKIRTIGQLFNLSVSLLDNDFKSIKDILLENSSFWVDLFAEKSKEIVTSNMVLPAGVNEDVYSAAFHSRLPGYSQILDWHNKRYNL
jgi:hypothetical protein